MIPKRITNKANQARIMKVTVGQRLRSFTTVRLRTDKAKGCLARDTALAMVFKLIKSAERRWCRLHGTNRIHEIINGITFREGEPIESANDRATARPPSTEFALTPS